MREGLRSHERRLERIESSNISGKKRDSSEVQGKRKLDINDPFDLSSQRQNQREAMKNSKTVERDQRSILNGGSSSGNIGVNEQSGYPIREWDDGTFQINWSEVNRQVNEFNRNSEQQPQLVAENQPPVHAPQGYVMTLEFVSACLNRSRGSSSLTTVQGVDMRNAIDDGMSARSSLRNEISEDLNNNAENNAPTPTFNVVEAQGKRRRKTKYSVCEQIVKQLVAAGWAVFYRPNNESEKYDGVAFLSPEEKSHWSIISAYNTLKHHYEAGDGEGKVYGQGFQFTPILEEDMKILTEGMGMDKKVLENEAVVVNERVENNNVGSSRRSLRPRRKSKTQGMKRCDYDPREEKRTVLSWLIDMGIVKENGKVRCMDSQGKCGGVDGEITREGIDCGCCKRIVTISEFEAHSRCELLLSDPLKNVIYVEGGASLMQCLVAAWMKQDESYRRSYHYIKVKDGYDDDDRNDSICTLCRDGGDLICCDTCTSSFHPQCLNMQAIPPGNWHCIYCRCKFCGLNGDPEDMGSFSGFFKSMLFPCNICDQKYHKACAEFSEANSVQSEHQNLCGNKCKEFFEKLQMLQGVKHHIKDGFSWTFIWRTDVDTNINWQIESRMVECNSKLAVALSIMNECFRPCVDLQSGINMIHSTLYSCGSNYARLSCKRFFTAILERGDEMISVATIRIHGNQLAEIPFIATRDLYRRQGMCRRLMNSIELGLGFLNVELMIIPSMTEVENTWIRGFGFEPIDSKNKEFIKTMNLLAFPGTILLQKRIPKLDF